MTLSVMDDLDFNTRYDCPKCEKLETDLKTSKSEVADLRNLVTVMRTQTAKTTTLLHKFDTTKKTLLLQKQKIEALEKHNGILKAEAKTVNEQLKKQLDSTEDSNYLKSSDEIEALRNNIQCQQAVIEQYKAQFSEMEKVIEEFKKKKTLADRSYGLLQAKVAKLKDSSKSEKKQPDNSEAIAKLKSEIGVLKRENTRLKDNREETVNRLADKKNQDITKKLTAMMNKQTSLDTTIEKTIERTIQRNLKDILLSPTKGGGMYRSPAARPRRNTKSTEGGVTPSTPTPAKKRGKPVGWKKNKPKQSSSEEDSELELSPRPKKSVKRPVKRKLSHSAEPKKKAKPLVQDSGHLSNSSSDDDIDLVGFLENSLNCPISARSEPDGVLVCDALPSTSSEFNLFDQHSAETDGIPKESPKPMESPKPQRKMPTVLNVKSIFTLMVSPGQLSPLKTYQGSDIPAEPIGIKNEEQGTTYPRPVVPTSLEESCVETPSSSSGPAHAVFSPKTTPKKEDQTILDPIGSSKSPARTVSPIVTETASTDPCFQPISIKNEMTKTKSEPNDPIITLKPMSSKEARSAPIVSTLGDLLSPSKIESDSAAASTPDVEIVSVVQVEREEPCVSASDSQTEDDLPEDSISKSQTISSKFKQVQIAAPSTSQNSEDERTIFPVKTSRPSFKPVSFVAKSSRPCFKPVAFATTAVQKPTQQVTSFSSGSPKSRFPPISMSFCKPKTSSVLLPPTVTKPDIVQKVNLPPISMSFVKPKASPSLLEPKVVEPEIEHEADLPTTLDTGAPTTSSAPDLTTKQEEDHKPSVTNGPVLSLAVPSPGIVIEASSTSNQKESHESDPLSVLCNNDSTPQVALEPKTSAVTPNVKSEKSPPRRQSEVNVTLSSDSLVTPTTPTEVVVSEDVMVCAFEMDISGVSSSQSDADTQSDSAADVSQSPRQVEIYHELLPTTRSRKSASNNAAFVAPRRARARKSMSQDQDKQPEVITKSLRNRKVSVTEESAEVSKRRRSARTSSVSDVSDSSRSPAPRRSRRIQNSISPVKPQKPKKSPMKQALPETLTPEEMIIDEFILGAENRNIMIPSDLLELKKSIDQAQLQETVVETLEQSVVPEVIEPQNISNEVQSIVKPEQNDSSENLEPPKVSAMELAVFAEDTQKPAEATSEPAEATQEPAVDSTPGPLLPLKTSNTDLSYLKSPVAMKYSDENNGAKAVDTAHDIEDQVNAVTIQSDVTVKTPTNSVLSEKRKVAKSLPAPAVKRIPPPPSGDWHAVKSLDLDLTPVSRKVEANNAVEGHVKLNNITVLSDKVQKSNSVEKKREKKERRKKRKAAKAAAVSALTMKTVPPPSCNWDLVRSLDLDLKTVQPFKEAPIPYPSDISDEDLMIADTTVIRQVVEDVQVDITVEEEETSPLAAPAVQVEKSDEVPKPMTEKEKTVKVVVAPSSEWFTAKSQDFTSVEKLPPFNAAAAVSDQSDSELPPKEVTTESRKRKKTKAPDHYISLAQIFDIFIPKPAITLLGFTKDNDDLVMDTSDCESPVPSPAAFSSTQKPIESVDVNLLSNLRTRAKKGAEPALPVDDEPLYHQTYEDYTHLVPHGTTQHLVGMFRRNLCTSAPDVPYIVETIVYNHKKKALQNIDEKLIRVIRNEISIRDTSPANVEIPPIEVLVEFFYDLFTQLVNSEYSYFDASNWMQDVLKKLFYQVSILKKNITQSLISLLSFSVKLSLKCKDLKYLRAYIIKTISDMNYTYVCNLLTKCFTSYSIFLLIGEQHLCFSKDKNSIKDLNCLYLTGLEFYLRYTQLKFPPVEQLSYIHQFAVENHLISAALDAVVIKEELGPGTDYKNHNQQGLICMKLMVKSQGWTWFTTTVLPLIFDKLSTTTEFGICKLTELIVNLVNSEIISYRAGGNITMLKEKLIPALIGLLWTAPTAEIKFSFARCLVQLSPLKSSYVSSSLQNWVNCIPVHFKEHRQYPELYYMIGFIAERKGKNSRTL